MDLTSYTPNIVTGIVSISVSGLALWYGYKHNKNVIKAGKENLERQLEVQLATTVNKEWVEKVRGYVTVCIESFILADELRIKSNVNNVNVATLEEYQNLLNKFRNSNILLRLSLSEREAKEKELIDGLAQLWVYAIVGDEKRLSTDVVHKIISTSKEILDRKLS
jgi:hypothetical protein